MIVSLIITLFTPKIMERLGRKKTCFLGIFFTNSTNISFLIFAHIVNGFGYVGAPCGSSMIIDSIDYGDLELGGRPDGTAFAMQILAQKVATAVGAAFGVFIIGVFGYVAGQEITSEVACGINIAVNLVPAIIFVLACSSIFSINYLKIK